MNVDTESIPDDLFQVIFIARATPSPWQALLVYSILLHNPVLSVLAACDEVITTTKLNYFKVIFTWCYFCLVMVDKDFTHELATSNEVNTYVDTVCRVILAQAQ